MHLGSICRNSYRTALVLVLWPRKHPTWRPPRAYVAGCGCISNRCAAKWSLSTIASLSAMSAASAMACCAACTKTCAAALLLAADRAARLHASRSCGSGGKDLCCWGANAGAKYRRWNTDKCLSKNAAQTLFRVVGHLGQILKRVPRRYAMHDFFLCLSSNFEKGSAHPGRRLKILKQDGHRSFLCNEAHPITL